MDLCKQLDITKQNWKMEKMELLDRFDSERKEWECQWKVMQKKIEELYQEVKLRRESNGKSHNESIYDANHKITEHPTYSEYPKKKCSVQKGSHHPGMDNMHPQIISEAKTSDLVLEYLVCDHHGEFKIDSNPKSTKKDNGTLNEALSEIAKVSKELCSYQDEIRKTPHRRRMKSYPLLGEYEDPEKLTNKSEKFAMQNSVQQAFSLKSQTKEINRNNQEYARPETILYGHINGDATQVYKPKCTKMEGPPVPPRSTSWHLSSPLTGSPQISNALGHDLHLTLGSQDCEGRNNSGSADRFSNCKATTSSRVASKDADTDFNSSFCGNMGTSSQCKTDFHNSKWLFSRDNSVKDNKSYVENSSPVKIQDLEYCTKSDAELQHRKVWRANMDLACDPAGHNGERIEQSLSNGKLSAKTDQFNTMVFQTNKCSIARQENPQSLTLTSCQHHSDTLLCSCKENLDGIEDAASMSSSGLLACKKMESSCHNGSIKISGQQKLINGFHNSSSYQQMLHEHNWRPSNLSRRPRSADSRSNYGVVEKLLKTYENSGGPSLCYAKGCNDKLENCDSVFADRSSETLNQYLEMLQIDQPELSINRKTTVSAEHPCNQETGQWNLSEMPLPGKSQNRKGFSRPACPANRRLPSRWASRPSSAHLSTQGCDHSYSFTFLSETSVV